MAANLEKNVFVCDECGGNSPPDPDMIVLSTLVREEDEREGTGMLVLEEEDLTELALAGKEELRDRGLTEGAREAILRGDAVIRDLPACLCYLCQDMMSDLQYHSGDPLLPFPTGLAPIPPKEEPRGT